MKGDMNPGEKAFHIQLVGCYELSAQWTKFRKQKLNNSQFFFYIQRIKTTTWGSLSIFFFQNNFWFCDGELFYNEISPKEIVNEIKPN